MSYASDELLTYGTQDEVRTSKVRVSRVAGRQFGRVTRAQLRALRVPRSTIDRWLATGYLIRVLPRVFAVGYVTPDDQRSRLFSLILFAGPNAALSHGTCAHWRGWLRYPVNGTHISTPRRIRTKLPGVAFHCNRELERELVDGVPCTRVAQTLLDVAATESRKLVHRSLAQLDYDGKLDALAIGDTCGRGRRGSAALLAALDTYMPQLAHTKSELEDEYLYVCQRFGIPLPEVNVSLYGEEPDCYWRDLGLVVELDGGRAHRNPGQRHRDQRKALKLRAHGLTVIRYTEDQVFNDARQVASDTLSQIEQRRKLMA
jgi:hypothetical protein